MGLFQLDSRITTGDANGDQRRFLFATREDAASVPLRVALKSPADL